ncbi:hypothetical protein F4777DRAFT_551900 [Nemania sp. FL0916]|nr:hypothetical protein F4777DRAFT_551900 [Nemania sp. FL0916]
MSCPPLARPSPSSPNVQLTEAQVCILHPGYSSPDNMLLALPAVDCLGPSIWWGQIWGLHHQTALTAGAIIANNAFGRAYFTYDQDGKEPVTTPLDGVLEPGNYYLQLKNEKNTASPGETSTAQPYPIVPTFADWQFPHGKLPTEWRLPHAAPSQYQDVYPPMFGQIFRTTDRCYLTDYRMGIKIGHLVPKREKDWFVSNGMARYIPGRNTNPHDGLGNLVTLQATFYRLFKQGRFIMVPKPSSKVPGPEPSRALSPTPTAPARPHALTIHVLTGDNESKEFADLYQNSAIQTKHAMNMSRELLFARFAWALFPLVQHSFMNSTSDRWLALANKDQGSEHVASDAPHTQIKKMSSQGFQAYLRSQADAPRESEERQPSQKPQDGIAGNDDADNDKWDQCSVSEESCESSILSSDSVQKRLDRDNKWYQRMAKYGVSTAVDHGTGKSNN